jgi:hypothetical protein
MSWNRRRTDDLANALRFVGWVFLAIDAILLAIFSLWFVWHFLAFFRDLLTRTMFSAPW